MKYLTFSRSYPAYHSRAGEPTNFVQKILYGQLEIAKPGIYFPLSTPTGKEVAKMPKYHTIRGGFLEPGKQHVPLERWKVGDLFSARTWEGKPYRSPQEEFAQLEIKKLWKITIDANGVISLEDKASDRMLYISDEMEQQLATNDGLELWDFQDWLVMPCFRKGRPFFGQVICWNEKIEYIF